MKRWIVVLGLLAATGAHAQSAAGQVNNGPGIGPSEGLERPDLQRQESEARGRGAATHLRSHHTYRPRAHAKPATGADAPPG